MATFEATHSGNANVITRVEINDGPLGQINYSISLVRLSSSVQSFNLFGSPSGPNIVNVNIFGYDLPQTFYTYDWWYRTTQSVRRFEGARGLGSLDGLFFRVGMVRESGIGLRVGSVIESVRDTSATMDRTALSTGTNSATFSRPQPAASVLIASGTLAVTPGSTGNVTLTNNAGSTVLSASINTSFTAAAPPIPAPVFTTGASLPDARRDSSYSTTINASDATGYSLVAGSFPTGISLSGNTISGTPTQAGISSVSYSFTIRASNSTGSVDRAFTLVVIPPAPVFSDQSITTTWIKTLNFSGAPDRTLAASDTSSFSIFASGSGTSPTSWLSINNSGQLSGLPATVGVYTFIIRASGDGGTADTSVITLTINPPGNRSTGTGVATDLIVTKRFDGSSWVNVNTFKRFDGNNWVDITN
jgi:hypothetical protein